MKCPNCQTENPSSARFCANCGTALVFRCTNCQAELATGARFCMYCGQPILSKTADDDARHARLAAAAPAPLAEKARAATLSGERRVVTVLFIDVVGSTDLAGRMDIETWTRLMNNAFDRITPIVYRYEGTIARLLGDSLVIFFGSPLAHEDDPQRGVRAALDLLPEIQDYAAQVSKVYDIKFEMRFCLNTGPVIVGPVSGDLKYEYTAVGGAVNLAARLKFAAQPMTVLISENTYRFVAPIIDCRDLGLIEVKDRGEPLRVFQVLGLKAEPGSLRGLVGLQSPMVGRDKELARLLTLCDTVRSGLGRALLVVGEPGLGKTRLITEWEAAIAASNRSPAPQWAEGRGLSYGQGIPYHLVIDLLRSLLGVPRLAGEAETHTALRSLITDLFTDKPHQTSADFGGADLSPTALEVYPFIGQLLSMNLQGEALERVRLLDPQALQAHYTSALRQLLQALASRRPLILILEDLHWGDPASIEMLANSLPLVFSAPILFCLVIRSDRDSTGWKLVTTARELLGNSLAEISLEPLSERYSRQLIANLLEIEALPEAMRNLILQKSEGNPFFVEEVVRMLIERNAITHHGDGWIANPAIGKVDIPDNLQGLLTARIDRLSDEGKYTLRVASVVGRQFPVKVLQQVLVQDGPKTQSELGRTINTLSNLESAGLIRVASVEPELEYLFRHTLVQDAAYASILVADRKRLHLSVGETLENMYPKNLDAPELAPRLARHFYEAGDDQRALKYFLLAGESALASFANQEAEIHYRRALSLACTPPQQAELLIGLGEALFNQSRYDDAIQTWREAIDFYRSMPDPNRMARLFARSARAAWWEGKIPLGLQLCQEGLAAIAGAPESADIALLVHEAARAYHFNGIPGPSKELCQQALEMAERLGAVEVQADALTTFGILPDITPEESLAALEKAVELAESSGLLIIATRAYINLGSMKFVFSGDMDAARDHYQRAVDITHERGVLREELFTRLELLGISISMGELNQVKEALHTLEEMANNLINPERVKVELAVFRSIIQFLEGSWEESLITQRDCIQQTRKHGDLHALANYDINLALFTIELHTFGQSISWEEAEAALAEAVELCERGVDDIVKPLCYLSEIRIRQGRMEEAEQLLKQAEDAVGSRPVIWLEILILWVKGNLAAAQRQWSQAFAAYEKAYSIVARIGHRWQWGTILISWANALVIRGEPADLERARGLLREASAIFEPTGATAYTRWIEQKRLSLREKMLAQALVQGEVVREMAQAQRLQKSFLPKQPAQIPGWELATALEPARQTSGDFYDFIALPEGRLGIVVADVADKGAGAALFMTSSRTLLRTYVEEFPTEPIRVISEANRRLLIDTQAGLFVTCYYAILDPGQALLTYCNAGHNPPFLFSQQSEIPVRSLETTGGALGILEDELWEQVSIHLEPGDVLVVFTDGVTEAQNITGDFYGEGRLKDCIRALMSSQSNDPMTAQSLLNRILADIHQFQGELPPTDDLTILVLMRN